MCFALVALGQKLRTAQTVCEWRVVALYTPACVWLHDFRIYAVYCVKGSATVYIKFQKIQF